MDSPRVDSTGMTQPMFNELWTFMLFSWKDKENHYGMSHNEYEWKMGNDHIKNFNDHHDLCQFVGYYAKYKWFIVSVPAGVFGYQWGVIFYIFEYIPHISAGIYFHLLDDTILV